jgi:hypothetical protein
VAHRAILRLAARSSRFQVVLLTDSRLLEQTFRRAFAQPVHTLPIPHTAGVTVCGSDPTSDDEIRCWWPGPPRRNKGLERIRELATRTEPALAVRLQLMLSRRAGLAAPAGCPVRIEPLPDPLSEAEYAAAMMRSEVILLPYDPSWYRDATSGIFVEAVCAGKLPLVSQHTWMAHELAAFGLERLALDWSRRDLLQEIARLHRDGDARARLQHMRRSYLAYHNPRSYGLVLSALIARNGASGPPDAFETFAGR